MSTTNTPARQPRPAPDTELLVAERWLDAWGLWARSRVALGLPSISVLGRIERQGPMAASQPGANLTPAHEQAEAVERVYVAAPARIKEIAREYYCTHRNDPMEVLARRLGTSRTGLYAEIRVVQAYFAGALFG